MLVYHELAEVWKAKASLEAQMVKTYILKKSQRRWVILRVCSLCSSHISKFFNPLITGVGFFFFPRVWVALTAQLLNSNCSSALPARCDYEGALSSRCWKNRSFPPQTSALSSRQLSLSFTSASWNSPCQGFGLLLAMDAVGRYHLLPASNLFFPGEAPVLL